MSSNDQHLPPRERRETRTLGRMAKRLRLATIAVVVAGLVLVGTARLVVVSPAERAQIRAADRASARFDGAMHDYVRSTGAAVDAEAVKVKTAYPALLQFVETRIADAPKVSTRGTTTYGRHHSDRYRSAHDRRVLALQPLVALDVYLKVRAIPDQAFVDAGKKLVQINPGKLLAGQNVTTGAPIRAKVIPAFEKARDSVAKQRTPANSGLVRFDLTTYANDAISQAKAGAKKLDAVQPFFFDLGSRPNDLYQRLIALQATIASDLGDRVDVLKLAE